MFPSRDRQRGSAELLLLALVRDRAMYGYEIVRELEARSQGYFAMEEGLLYPTLHRLEREGLVRAEWRVVEGRKRRYYAATESGLAVLTSATADWTVFLNRFLDVLNPSGGKLHGEAKPLLP